MKESRTTVALALIVSITIIALWLIYSSRNASRLSEKTITNISQTSNPSLYTTKERSEGNVTVSATPQVLTEGSPPSFYVEFETHSVELDFEVPQIAALIDDQGSSLEIALWDGSPPGGHHRKGTLSFANNLLPSTKSVTLTFSDIADVPARTFTWEVRK